MTDRRKWYVLNQAILRARLDHIGPNFEQLHSFIVSKYSKDCLADFQELKLYLNECVHLGRIRLVQGRYYLLTQIPPEMLDNQINGPHRSDTVPDTRNVVPLPADYSEILDNVQAPTDVDVETGHDVEESCGDLPLPGNVEATPDNAPILELSLSDGEPSRNELQSLPANGHFPFRTISAIIGMLGATSSVLFALILPNRRALIEWYNDSILLIQLLTEYVLRFL